MKQLLTLSIIFALGFLILVTLAGEPDKPQIKLTHFKSEVGGFEVDIPPEWHILEIPKSKSYQAAFSREPVNKQGDQFQYGLSILRLKKYKDLYEFKSKDPKQMALEYAQRFASSFKGEGKNLIMALPTSDRGINASFFVVFVNQGTDDEMVMWLLVGVKGKQWFQALWEIPGSEAKAHTDEVMAMVKSLKVNPKYKGPKK